VLVAFAVSLISFFWVIRAFDFNICEGSNMVVVGLTQKRLGYENLLSISFRNPSRQKKLRNSMIHVGVIAKCLKLILHCFEVEYAGKAVENSGTTLAICCKAHFLEVGRALQQHLL
jgi:hypothetical protein